MAYLMTETPMIESLQQAINAQTATIKAQGELLAKILQTLDGMKGKKEKMDTVKAAARPAVKRKAKAEQPELRKAAKAAEPAFPTLEELANMDDIEVHQWLRELTLKEVDNMADVEVRQWLTKLGAGEHVLYYGTADMCREDLENLVMQYGGKSYLA